MHRCKTSSSTTQVDICSWYYSRVCVVTLFLSVKERLKDFCISKQVHQKRRYFTFGQWFDLLDSLKGMRACIAIVSHSPLSLSLSLFLTGQSLQHCPSAVIRTERKEAYIGEYSPIAKCNKSPTGPAVHTHIDQSAFNEWTRECVCVSLLAILLSSHSWSWLCSWLAIIPN